MRRKQGPRPPVRAVRGRGRPASAPNSPSQVQADGNCHLSGKRPLGLQLAALRVLPAPFRSTNPATPNPEAPLYLTGSLGIGKFKLTGTNSVDGESKSGFAMALGMGKEWWVGNEWGLGLAGGLTYHSIADKDVSENWSGTSFTLRFSATMN